jgi:hypothetical protein
MTTETAINMWSTEKVEEIMQKLDEGVQPKVTPFWDGKPEWKLANISFEYTPEELSEIEKCATDIIYFANTYCFSMTDEGIQKIKLRDYQEDVLRDYQDNRFNIFLAPRQIGKAQPLDSIVWGENGKIKFGDLNVGDKIYGADGKLTNVVGIYPQGIKDIYKITFSDGTSVRCCKEHLWTVETAEGKTFTLQLSDLIDRGILTTRGDYKFFVKTTQPVEFKPREFSIDPYTLGLIIGDEGVSQSCTTNSTNDVELVEHFNKVCAEHNLRHELNKLGLGGALSNSKFIPSDYLYGSIEQRIALLQGLMDTDGHCSKKSNIEFCTVSEKLADDVQQLCESLGIVIRRSTKNTSYVNKEGVRVECQLAHRLKLQLPNNFPYPIFRLARKQENVRNKRYDWGRRRGIAKIELVSSEEAQCIQVDNEDHLYLTDHFIPTHNTVITGIYLSWYLLFNVDKNLMVLSNTGSTTEEIIDKIKTVLSNLPFFMKPGIFVNNVMSMKFDNGCRLIGRTTTKNSAIGFTIHNLFCDEFAHIHPNFIEPFWRSVYPTLSSSKVSRCTLTSTPNGLNKFHEIYQGAVEGKNEFNPIRVDWWQVPGRDEEWMQREIANLGSIEDFNQEYGNQFLASDKLLLDGQTLSGMKNKVREFRWMQLSDLDDTGVDYEHLKWHPLFDFDKVSESDQFVFSIDTANGGGGDHTVINIFKLIPMPPAMVGKKLHYQDESDFFSLMQVGLFRNNRQNIEEVQVIIEALLFKIFSPEQVKVVLEMDFKGNLLYDRISMHADFWEDIFIHTKHTQSATQLKPGVKLNPKNKLEYCIELKRLIKGARIITFDKLTFDELSAFGVNNRGSYSSQSGHDDIAMTLVNLTVFFDSPQYYEMVEISFDYLDDKYKKAINEKLNNNVDDSPDFDFSDFKV